MNFPGQNFGRYSEGNEEYEENYHNENYHNDNYDNEGCQKWSRQHVHEFLGSTRIAELGEDPHNHRFAGVSGPAIPFRGSHIHGILTRTDSTDHLHIIRDFSGPAISVGNGRHVHFVRGNTSFNDGHVHRYIFATLIENPLGTNRRC